MGQLSTAFPYFGGKARVAGAVWDRLGSVSVYIEPFCGSAAVLLGCPYGPRSVEILNDFDCYIANFFRSVKLEPDVVIEHAMRPCVETDMRAVHRWLKRWDRDGLRERLENDLNYCEPELAGLWVWAACLWFGEGLGVVSSERRGMMHAGNRMGVCAYMKDMCGVPGKLFPESEALKGYIACLACRLSTTQVLCADWSRAVRPAILARGSTVGVFLDPPYSYSTGRRGGIYNEDSADVAADVREWCKEHGSDKRLRIALCGLHDEHSELEECGWTVFEWVSHGLQNRLTPEDDPTRQERIWFSPHCNVRQLTLPLDQRESFLGRLGSANVSKVISAEKSAEK